MKPSKRLISLAVVCFLFTEIICSDLNEIFSAQSNRIETLSETELVDYISNKNQLIVEIIKEDSTSSGCVEINNIISSNVNKNDFYKTASKLLGILDKCKGKQIKGKNLDSLDSSNHTTIKEKKELDSESSFKVWLYATLSVSLISIIGLLCVVIVPILNKCCFNYLFQLLTALALGTLCSDALLHLIPHALLPHHHSNEHSSSSHDHSSGVFKGICVLLGMYFIYFYKYLSQARDSLKKRREKKKDLNNIMNYDQVDKRSISKTSHDIENLYMNFADHENKSISYSLKKHTNEPNLNKHNHGHSHNHEPNLKSSIWMIIIGDGLHNFSDGLAIGASFGLSITTGIGTSIAVFFHELPHEIGDFAVLKKNGVPLKKAILYNILSSFLCFVGVVIGIFIGKISFISNWSFLFIAGTFLYISLVNILPELEVEKKGILLFLLQNVGMFFGVGIMLSIAIYEDKIVNFLEN